jgi:hypothetical protein
MNSPVKEFYVGKTELITGGFGSMSVAQKHWKNLKFIKKSKKKYRDSENVEKHCTQPKASKDGD